MKITPDTNVLVRAIMVDDERQSELAQAELTGARAVALALPALCELVWVLSKGYKVPVNEIAQTIRTLARSSNVVVNRPAVDAGLAMLDAGGDFSDGVIAFEGQQLGADVLVSFDRQAVKLLISKGKSARLLS
jgi:predicted nucleic-acid-binding protein